MSGDKLETQLLREYTEKAYLDYSMYVILDRTLPHIGDGLKPVQRRIVYAMGELNLGANAKHKKSARTIGDALGKVHPHGDSACYEAMVLMAQPFSYRYPLVDGQGNWGSPDDPKSFAAMRYTESRLAPCPEVLKTAQHTYDHPGRYTVAVKVIDSEQWIQQRMTGQETHNKLTDYWANHDIRKLFAAAATEVGKKERRINFFSTFKNRKFQADPLQ